MQWGRDWLFRCGILEYVISILNLYTYNQQSINSGISVVAGMKLEKWSSLVGHAYNVLGPLKICLLV